MQVVILAGGLGTRISEETYLKPKPMIEIGGFPILWHIMKIYSFYGFNEFIICAGYKGNIIKEYFSNYNQNYSDLEICLTKNEVNIIEKRSEPWNIKIIDTGEFTMTGGRIKRIEKYIKGNNFCLTYGDGVSNINIPKLINYHKSSKCLATLTAVKPPSRFGALVLDTGTPCLVKEFKEKKISEKNRINGGFFVLEKDIFDFINNGDNTVWEEEPLELLSAKNLLSAYLHNDFWCPMDTLRDKRFLEKLWAESNAPWKVW